MTSHTPLTGLIAAPYTAFHPDGSLDLGDSLKSRRHRCSRMTSPALSSAAPPARESRSRSPSGCKWPSAGRKSPAPDFRVIVHVGHNCLADSPRAGRTRPEKIGATGVGCLSPFFFKPANAGDLAAFCADVALAAPELAFTITISRIPSMTGVSIPAADFLRAAGPQIPNLAGVKFTHENLMDFAECVGIEKGRYDIVFGRDEICPRRPCTRRARSHWQHLQFPGSRLQRSPRLLRQQRSGRRAGETGGNQCRDFHFHPLWRRPRGGQGDDENDRPRLRSCDAFRLRPLSEQRQAKLQSELESVFFFDSCSKV